MISDLIKNKEKLTSFGIKILIDDKLYKGSNFKYNFMCENGHIWEGRLNDLLHTKVHRESKGCPTCAEAIYIKQSLEVANANLLPNHKIIDSYLKASNGADKRNVRIYKAECEFGHQYEKRSGKLKDGCPKCSEKTYVGQERVRIMFEYEFGLAFPTVRPDWLKNPLTNRNLELDGYCEKLKLAFEYQGRQHNSNDTGFGGDYLNQKERDNYKLTACKEHGIKLVTIMQPSSYDKAKFFESVILDCQKEEIDFKSSVDDVNFNKINDNNTTIKNYTIFKDFVNNKGYYLVSASLSTMEDVLEFKCKEHHFFKMKASTFKTILNTTKYRNEPCLECHAIHSPDKIREIINIETCKNFAIQNNLTCLSTKYKNVNEKMQWQCHHGYVFEKSYRQFLRSKTQNYCSICHA